MSEDARRNMLWASALVRSLVEGGVRDVVISPGSRSTPVVLAFAAIKEVRTHVVLDERVAGFVALGMSRASGRAAALVCTSGSAVAHYLPALIEAFHARVPLLVLGADRPPELQGSGAGQTIDQTRIFGSYTRLFVDLGTPNAQTSPRWLRTVALRALRAAHGHESGPVHLNLPFRKPLWTLVDENEGERVQDLRLFQGNRTLDPAALDALAQEWSGKKGAIVCGPWWPQGSLSCSVEEARHRFQHAIFALASRLGWPILAEPASQLRIEASDSALVISSADALLRDESVGDALAPEVILCFGQVPTSKWVGLWIARHGMDRTYLVDPDGQWSDPHHCARTMIEADPARFGEALLGRISLPAPPRWGNLWSSAEHAAQDALHEVCTRDGWEGALARCVAQALPAGAGLHLSSSMPIRDMGSFSALFVHDVPVWVSRGANGIDGTIATAMGETLAYGKPGVLVIGDMAFLHDAGALLASFEWQVDLTIVVIQNGGGGIFDILPISRHPNAFERFFTTPQKTRIEDLCLAASVPHRSVRSLDSLGSLMQTSLEEGGLSVLEVHVDRERNMALHAEAWDAVSAAARRTLEVGE